MHLLIIFDSFCTRHSNDDALTQAQWLLIRDILHALLVPVVELFDKAVSIAHRVTPATLSRRQSRPEDLEFAFAGDGRSAFLWLQCFLSTEREQDWCSTRGCPACVVDHSLDSEFNIRLLYAACLLSDVHYPFTMEGPTLPSFTFFLESLERAIADDPLFGDDFFERMQPKAIATRDGVEDLIHQCLELEGLLSQPTSPLVDGDMVGSPVSPLLAPLGGTQPMTKLKRSKMAKRQLKLKAEAEFWIEEILTKCYDTLHPVEAYHHHLQQGLTPIDGAASSVPTCAMVRVTELAPK